MNNSKKPQFGSVVQNGHSLANGMQMCLLMNEMRGDLFYSACRKRDARHHTRGSRVVGQGYNVVRNDDATVTFDGSSSIIILNDEKIADGQGLVGRWKGITLATLVKPTAGAANTDLILAQGAYNNPVQLRARLAGRFQMRMLNQNSYVGVVDTGATDYRGEWSLVVASWQPAGDMTIWKDGVLKGTTTRSGQTLDEAERIFSIGAGVETADNRIYYWPGDMDFAMAWNRPLSHAEIVAFSIAPYRIFERPVITIPDLVAIDPFTVPRIQHHRQQQGSSQ